MFFLFTCVIIHCLTVHRNSQNEQITYCLIVHIVRLDSTRKVIYNE
nr:MAG TPA: hypothetical protein [Caudoviricetes sp.]